MPFDLQILVGTCFATVFEGIAGIILNVFLGLDIWDYSNLWGTFFFGQCNVFFCVAWAVLLIVYIVLQDCLVYYVLRTDDERPHYHIWNGKILFWLPKKKQCKNSVILMKLNILSTVGVIAGSRIFRIG